MFLILISILDDQSQQKHNEEDQTDQRSASANRETSSALGFAGNFVPRVLSRGGDLLQAVSNSEKRRLKESEALQRTEA